MARRFAKLEFTAELHAAQEGQALAAAPEDLAAKHLAGAREAQRWGRFDEALRLFTRALNEERTLVAAWVGQVQMLVQLDECHEARVWSDKALQLFCNQPDLLAAQAQALARLHDLPAALARSDAALQAGGAGPWPWQVRGEVLLARRARLADDCFDKALQLPAADWFDRVLVAGIYQYYGRLTSALHYLKAALALEPAHGYPWLLMGQCQRGLGLSAAAAGSFARAAELAPDWAAARHALAQLDRGPALGTWLRRMLPWRRR